jgi:hypothetical protein
MVFIVEYRVVIDCIAMVKDRIDIAMEFNLHSLNFMLAPYCHQMYHYVYFACSCIRINIKRIKDF